MPIILQDNWHDERKASGYIGMKLFAGKKKKIAKQYPRQAKVIEQSLQQLAKLEQELCSDIDTIAKPFGTLMAELFVWKEDAFQTILRAFGFYPVSYTHLTLPTKA